MLFRSRAEHAGIVYEHVDRSEIVSAQRDEFFRLSFIGNVRLFKKRFSACRHDFQADSPEQFNMPRAHAYDGSFAGKPFRDSPPDSARGAADDCNFVGQFHFILFPIGNKDIYFPALGGIAPRGKDEFGAVRTEHRKSVERIRIGHLFKIFSVEVY